MAKSTMKQMRDHIHRMEDEPLSILAIIVSEYGRTDAVMKPILRERGFGGLDDELTLAECAANSGFIYSFRHRCWFLKRPDVDSIDKVTMEEYEAFIDEVKGELERK